MTAKKFPTSFPNLSETELLNLEKASRESNPRQKRTTKIKHYRIVENLQYAWNSMCLCCLSLDKPYEIQQSCKLLLAELVLTLNYFHSQTIEYYMYMYMYKQISGVAMVTKMGPGQANLFVGYIEHQLFNQYNSPSPELYCRYIATSSTREEVNQFRTAVNLFHQALKYTWETSNISLSQHFWISKFLLKSMVYAPAFITNLQIHIQQL